jgi:two-component system LytT family response regulator
MKKISTVIIDDEASNRRLIRNLIDSFGAHLEILGEAEGVASAFDLIISVKPELIFLDIKMQDGSGFDLLEKFEHIDFEVVFITGFDSYAIQAFEFNALDYILKPINPVKFAKLLNKIGTRLSIGQDYHDNLKQLLQSYNLKAMTMSKIPVHSGNSVVLLNIQDIIYLKADQKCTVFVTTDGKYLSSKELSDFEFILSNHSYMVRISKSVFISVNYIQSYTKGKTCYLTMTDGTVMEVSRRKKSEILALLTSKSILGSSQISEDDR